MQRIHSGRIAGEHAAGCDARMLRLGIRAHDFGLLPLDELARRVAAGGFCGVQFAAPKSIAGLNDDVRQLTPGLAVQVRETFQREGVQVAVLGCYINLVNLDADRRRSDLARFKTYLRLARDFGCGIVGTETGSLNADFSFHPDNHGEAAYRVVRDGVGELLAEAARFGVCVGIEAVASLVISSRMASIWRIIFFMFPPFNIFIIFCICWNCFISWFTSTTSRRRRWRCAAAAAVEDLGLAALLLVIDLMIASVRAILLLGVVGHLHAAHAGHHAQDALHRAELLHLLHLREEVLEVEVGLAELLRHLSASFWSIVSWARSTSETTSPMPRMR
jgi:hypothetical protein